MSNGPVIGIDLGTTNSVVAVADQPGGRVLAGSDGVTLIPSVVFMSNCAWEELTPDEQTALTTAAHNSMMSHGEEWKIASDKAIEDAQSEMGVEIHQVDKAPFIEAVQPMYDEAASANPEIGTLIEQIRASAP